MTQAIYGHAAGHEIEPGMQKIELVPVGYREDALAVAAGDRTLEGEPDLTEVGMGNMVQGVIHDALEQLEHRERHVVESRFGFLGEPMTLGVIGDELGISPQAASQIGIRGLERLERLLSSAGFGPNGAYDDIDSRWTPDQRELQALWLRRIEAKRSIRTGAPKKDTGTKKRDIPEWTPEQILLQQEWLDELDARQEAGEIVFVQGSLLREPLPEEIEKYLSTNFFGGRSGGAALRLAIQTAEEQRDPELRRQAELRRSEEKIKEATAKANRAHNKVKRQERYLALAKEEFNQAVAEGAEVLAESGYPGPEPQPEE